VHLSKQARGLSQNGGRLGTDSGQSPPHHVRAREERGRFTRLLSANGLAEKYVSRPFLSINLTQGKLAPAFFHRLQCDQLKITEMICGRKWSYGPRSLAHLW
jgi:hypothetical protein